MTTTPPPSPSNLRPAIAPLLPTVGPSVRDAFTKAQARLTPATGPEQPDLRPASLAPARSPSSQAYPPTRLTLPPPCLFTDTDIPSVAYKTPCNFYREGTILPVFVPMPVNTNIPGTHWGAPGISVKDQSVHLMILVTRPEPTVRPPSRIAKPRPSSMAMGWIS